MASYKLPLKSLSLGIQQFSYRLGDAEFVIEEPSDVKRADVAVTLEVERKSEDIFVLRFDFNGSITITCDRCLDDMDLPVETDYEISVKMGDAYDDSRDNVLVVPSHWRELDLLPLMRDTVLLTIPIKHVHADGECNEAMMKKLSEMRADLDDDEAVAATDESEKTFTLGDDPRWAALKKLNDNN